MACCPGRCALIRSAGSPSPAGDPDPLAFEIIVLGSTGHGIQFARRFRAIAKEWHDIDAIDDAGVAALARSAGIDVLIDLAATAMPAACWSAAHRAAPVQIKWVGMQNHSSGLAEMDWFITDRWETPPGFEQLYSERLLRLPDGYIWQPAAVCA